jgi:predicted MPP superfamily phosphohydrolase
MSPHSEQVAVSTELKQRLRRFMLNVLPILLGLHIYIGWRLLPALPLAMPGLVVCSLALVLSVVLLPMGMMARFVVTSPRWADRLSWAGSVTMGLFSSLLVLTLLRDFVLLVAGKGGVWGEFSAVLVIALALAVTVLGYVNARRLARVVRLDIPLADLPEAFEGFTICQISDIHVGPTIKRDYVQAIVSRVNELKPDVIAITGDVVDGSVEQLATHTAPLGQLSAEHGVYLVSGNHEYYAGIADWLVEFQRLGLRCLMNEHVLIARGDARFVLAGVTDYSAHLFDPAQRSDPAAAVHESPEGLLRILLAHQPRTASAALDAGFDLQLSGHTHGGQFWPWNLFVILQQPFTAGLHRMGRLQVYTSRGTGYWGPPKRFGAPSEISLLRLVRAS